MDVKLSAKSAVTSGGGAQSGSFVGTPGTGYIAFTYPPPAAPEVLLEIHPKHHSIRVLRLPDGEIRVVFEEVDGIYTGEAIHTLFDDIHDAMEAVHGALTEQEDEYDDDDDFEDEDEDTTESEETPPPPATQADGEAETFGTIEMLESTFCVCADCRRRRL